MSAVTTRPTELFIGGAWRASTDGRRMDVTDPADGSILASVADGAIADGLRAVGASSDALPAWSARAPRERGEILRRSRTSTPPILRAGCASPNVSRAA
jgi:succinate-semialdehyde dehydrogenase/glutarate-semialdehyde dehydrogenase